MDEVRHQLHNEKVMRELEDSKSELEASINMASSEEKAIAKELRKSSKNISESSND